MRRHTKSHTKADAHDSITHLNRTTTLEWCVVRHGYKNGRHKYTHLNEIKLSAHNTHDPFHAQRST